MPVFVCCRQGAVSDFRQLEDRMKQTRTKLAVRAAGILCLGMATSSQAQVPPDAVTQSGSMILGRFMAAVRACGVEPRFVPTLVVKTAPQVVFYLPKDDTIHLSRWEEMPPPVQGFMAEWAKQGSLGLAPPAMFAEIFNNLLVPHELGHYLQTNSAHRHKLDLWQSELEANQIAIAFWSMTPEAKAGIAERVRNFERFLGTLPTPVPAGTDPHAYFEANYEKLGSDAAAYGWYQGAFMRAAWAKRDEHDFCGWVRLNKPDPTLNPSARGK